MERKNKKQERQVFFKKVAIFFVIVFLAWFNLSRANLNEYNIFQDKDQDGLSDKEEFSYGTDPEKEDSDGDGYSDKVEIESGYDPLKPAPGDKIITTKTRVLGVDDNNNKNNKKNDINLTDTFINKVQEQELLGQLNSEFGKGGLNEDLLEKITSSNSGIDDFSLLFEETMKETEVVQDNEILITDDDIKIIAKPEGNEEDVKKEEKKQIEKYMASLLYVLAVNKPFMLTDVNELPTQMNNLIYELNSDIQGGEVGEIKEFKEKVQTSFSQIQKIEVPYILKDNHLEILSLHEKLSNNIDEEKLVSDEDPLASAMYLGQFQAVIFEAQDVYSRMNDVLLEYDIHSFNLVSGLGLGDEMELNELDIDTFLNGGF